MPKINYNIPSSSINPGMGPGVGPGGTTTAFLADRFGSGHIAPFAPFVGGFLNPSFRHKIGVHSHGGDPIHVNVGGTTYI